MSVMSHWANGNAMKHCYYLPFPLHLSSFRQFLFSSQWIISSLEARFPYSSAHLPVCNVNAGNHVSRLCFFSCFHRRLRRCCIPPRTRLRRLRVNISVLVLKISTHFIEQLNTTATTNSHFLGQIVVIMRNELKHCDYNWG